MERIMILGFVFIQFSKGLLIYSTIFTKCHLVLDTVVYREDAVESKVNRVPA